MKQRSNLPNEGFKVTVINILTKFRRRMHELSQNVKKKKGYKILKKINQS